MGTLSTPSELGALDFLLSNQSYILGHEPTQADVTVYEALKESPPSYLPHAARWYRHLDSFEASERQNFTGKIQRLEELTGGRCKVQRSYIPNDIAIQAGVLQIPNLREPSLNSEMSSITCQL